MNVSFLAQEETVRLAVLPLQERRNPKQRLEHHHVFHAGIVINAPINTHKVLTSHYPSCLLFTSHLQLLAIYN